MRESRAAALCALLALPDEDDLPRAHRVTAEGKPRRYELIPELRAMSCAHRELERLNDDHARTVETTT
jgi:hypothetical protein